MKYIVCLLIICMGYVSTITISSSIDVISIKYSELKSEFARIMEDAINVKISKDDDEMYTPIRVVGGRTETGNLGLNENRKPGLRTMQEKREYFKRNNPALYSMMQKRFKSRGIDVNSLSERQLKDMYKRRKEVLNGSDRQNNEMYENIKDESEKYDF